MVKTIQGRKLGSLYGYNWKVLPVKQKENFKENIRWACNRVAYKQGVVGRESYTV